MVPVEYIESLLVKKQQWIEQTISAQNLVSRQCNLLTDGGRLWFSGELHVLAINFGTSNQVNVNNGQIIVTLKKNKQLNCAAYRNARVKSTLEKWFKSQANEMIAEKLAYFSNRMQLSYRSFECKKYSARWGSCNNKGELKFNCFLLMAPDWVVNYVVVHELSHLIHMNHSAKFWRFVGQYFPQYLAAKQWLNQHQSSLEWPKEVIHS